eukprot:12405394-Karenia_brevis.AAC.1
MPNFENLVPGRICRLELKFSIDFSDTDDLATLRICNVHDEQLPLEASVQALHALDADIRIAQQFPMQHVVILA